MACSGQIKNCRKEESIFLPGYPSFVRNATTLNLSLSYHFRLMAPFILLQVLAPSALKGKKRRHISERFMMF